MESKNRMIGAGVIVLVLVSGAWMMGRRSAAPQNAIPNAFGSQGPQSPQAPMMGGAVGGEVGGAVGGNVGGTPISAAQPNQAVSPYGANPGMEMPSQPGQMNQGTDMSPQAPTGGAQDQYQPPGGSGGDQYRDPQGQFAIRIPPGWQSTPQNGGVILTRGSSMVMVSPFDGAQSGEQIVSTLARQYHAQWNNLQLNDQGQFSIGGAPAAYMMMSGTSPRGVQSLLRIAGAVRGNQGFAVIISTPLSEFNSASPQLQAIESSLSFGGGQ